MQQHPDSSLLAILGDISPWLCNTGSSKVLATILEPSSFLPKLYWDLVMPQQRYLRVSRDSDIPGGWRIGAGCWHIDIFVYRNLSCCSLLLWSLEQLIWGTSEHIHHGVNWTVVSLSIAADSWLWSIWRSLYYIVDLAAPATHFSEAAIISFISAPSVTQTCLWFHRLHTTPATAVVQPCYFHVGMTIVPGIPWWTILWGCTLLFCMIHVTFPPIPEISISME